MSPRCALAACLLAVLAAAPAAAATLSVFAAASLSESFTEIGRLFESRNPGWRVRANFAGSQQLAAQIEQGAAADVFASADARWMSYLSERSLVDGDTAAFARNRLAVIVPAANPARIARLQDLARRGVKLVLGAPAVPVGQYGRAALANLVRLPGFAPDFARRALANVVSEEENVKSVVGKVQLGEADAGVVYRSDVTRAVARYVRVLDIPDAADVLAAYPIAVVRGTKNAAAAHAFVALVRSSEGQRILARHGLIPVSP
jgi:molybdate transport system substrate-binding protein